MLNICIAWDFKTRRGLLYEADVSLILGSTLVDGYTADVIATVCHDSGRIEAVRKRKQEKEGVPQSQVEDRDVLMGEGVRRKAR